MSINVQGLSYTATFSHLSEAPATKEDDGYVSVWKQKRWWFLRLSIVKASFLDEWLDTGQVEEWNLYPYYWTREFLKGP